MRISSPTTRMSASPAAGHARRRHGGALAREAAPRRPTVVLALDDHSPPSCAIARAARAAHALRADLHVVIARSLSGGDDRDAPASLLRIVDRIRELAPAHHVDIEFRAGEVQHLAIEVGNAWRAKLMVVTPDTGVDGASAVAIAPRWS
jgi:hypothetical protein